MTPEIVKKACAAVGSQQALATLLGMRSQGSISRWIATGRIPAERVLQVERVSGVPRYELRPDLYPRESSAA